MLRPLFDGVLRKAARHSCSEPFAMRNTGPLVSFTFDDVPASAYSNGATILEQHGIRGTFYIAAGILGTMDEHWRVIGEDQVRALHAQGHEIGCHTFSHVRVDSLDAASTDAECNRNAAAISALCPGLEMTNFCYPFGRVSLPRKWQLNRRFDSGRGIYEGINSGTVDLALLRVIELYDRTLTPEKLKRALDETRARNGWLIFYTHDVTETPSWIGCSPRLLRETIATVQAQNMDCLTIRDGLAAIGRSASPAGETRRGRRSLAAVW
ncbi:MAG TPA: polysaccharide deacetylase family protein [Xanthobacteraceae bacterium]|jgi:peptidoglycan/xylan/chitin deacetylase (PgdA/CDA1 family)|nr:polysaccharide deacetylase family protein [Xanthobacteraceae bacterium]